MLDDDGLPINLSAWEREVLLSRLPQDNKPDAHDKRLPLSPPGGNKADPRPETERSEAERNPYHQSVAPPTYLFECPACGERRALEMDKLCPQCVEDLAVAGLILMKEEG